MTSADALLRYHRIPLTPSLNDAVDRASGVLKWTRAGEELYWDINLSPDLAVHIDNHDLIELLGVVLDNAAKWAKSKVIVRAERSDGNAIIEIVDDGPGLQQDQLEAIATRGHRADQSVSSTGLAIAIAKEIVTLNSGAIEFRAHDSGGLVVRLVLPLAAASLS